MVKIRPSMTPHEVLEVSEKEAAYLESQGYVHERLSEDAPQDAPQDEPDTEPDADDTPPDDTPPPAGAGRPRMSTPKES